MSSKFENKDFGIITKVETRYKGMKILYWIMFCILLLTAAICLIPTLWIFSSGLKDTREFYEMTIIPRTFHPEKFIEIWKRFNFKMYYINSLIQAVGEWGFCIVFNGLTGYVLSRLKPRGGFLVMSLVLLLMMIPNTISMVPLYKTLVDFPIFHFSLLNTYWPLWLSAGANCFNILLFKNFFDTIPSSLIEAAQIDGYSNLRIFFKIVIPLSMPIIAVVSIFSFNASWNSFLWPYLVLTKENLKTVSIFLFCAQGAGYPADQYMIMLIFSMLPPIIIFIFMQKQILGGLSVGGVKG